MEKRSARSIRGVRRGKPEPIRKGRYLLGYDLMVWKILPAYPFSCVLNTVPPYAGRGNEYADIDGFRPRMIGVREDGYEAHEGINSGRTHQLVGKSRK